MPISHVFLDIDGTLIDSNNAHADSWVDTAVEFGYDRDFSQIRPLIGMGGDRMIPLLFGVRAEDPVGQAMSRRRWEIFQERYLPQLRAFPHARDLVAAFQAAGVGCLVATSSREEELAALIEVAGIGDLVPEWITASDVADSKPAPDIVREALARAHCPPGGALMLGDTPYDVEAAQNAGVAIIALRSGGWRDADLSGALAIFDDPADLLAHLDSLPLPPRPSVQPDSC